MLNKWIGIGRLTRDPDSRTTPNGVPVTSFTIAVDRGKDRGTNFIDVQAWRGLAETCANYLSKGKLCAVEGELEISTFEGQDGQKRKTTRINASNVQFLSPKEGQRQEQTEDEDYLGEPIPF